jgi:hypothetical protein
MTSKKGISKNKSKFWAFKDIIFGKKLSNKYVLKKKALDE